MSGSSLHPQRHVLVLKGGALGERAVSLESGQQVEAALASMGHQVETLDVKDGAMLAEHLLKSRPEVVFNALHGTPGEDGRIQGLLDMFGIAYTHSGVLASALAMNKHLCKQLAERAGLCVAEGYLNSFAGLCEAGIRMDPPLVVKPNTGGSSRDVTILADKKAIQAYLHQKKPPTCANLLVERYIPGRELTVSVMGGRALGVTEIVTTRGFYDYTAKYAPGGSVHHLPAPVPAAIQAQAKEMALVMHAMLGCDGVTRCDMRYGPSARLAQERLVFLEVNTQPGMTPTSLTPEQAAHSGMSFEALVVWLLKDAACCR